MAGIPTPDSNPATAYRNICIIFLDGWFSCFATSLSASPIFADSHSCIPSNFSVVSPSTLSITVSSSRGITDCTYSVSRMTVTEIGHGGQGVIWLSEEVRSGPIYVFESMYPFLRHLNDLCKIISRRHHAIFVKRSWRVRYSGDRDFSRNGSANSVKDFIPSAVDNLRSICWWLRNGSFTSETFSLPVVKPSRENYSSAQQHKSDTDSRN